MSTANRGHVCIYTTAHPSDDVRVNSRIAAALLQANYRVTWIGPENSYFHASSTPNERINYRLFRRNDSKFKRLSAAKAAARQSRGLRDVDWWYSPDPDAAASAVKVARRNGGRVLVDIHEIFHGALLDRWFPKSAPAGLREFVRRRIAATCRRSDLVIGVSEAVLRPYVSRGTHYEVVRNCAPSWFAKRIEKSAADGAASERVRIMHGKCIPSNGALAVVEAARLLDAESAGLLSIYMSEAAGGNTPFVIGIADRLADLPEGLVTLAPGVPHEAMPALLQTCEVGMVAYGRDLGADSLPNRLFEYMASGLAVLAPSYAVEIADIIETERIGVVADFEDPEAIAAAFRWITKNRGEVQAMGERARAAFVERFNWDAEAEKMLAAMQRLETA